MDSISRARMNDGDVAAHVALAATTYPGAPPSESGHFRWKHLANPNGASIAITLAGVTSDDPMRGHVFVQQRPWVCAGGSEHAAGLITDLVLAPDARNARSFIALMTEARATTDIQLILHTSNETSDALYRRLLRYPVALELRAYGVPTGRLRIPAGDGARGAIIGIAASIGGVVLGWIARGLAPVLRRTAGLRVSSARPCERMVDAALERFRRAAGAHLRRDTEYLAWRFEHAPDGADLRWLRLRDGAIGYLATARVQVGDLHALGIQDVAISRPPRKLEGIALRTTVVADAARAGAGVALGLWNPAARLSRWMTGLPFIQVPAGLLPHESPIFASIDDSLNDAAVDLASAYVTLGDLDYF
jgi:hypothetical protein